MNLILPLHNIKLIDFSYVIQKCVETPLLNDLESYGLILDGKVNIKNRDVKRLIYHHVIYELCEHVLCIRGKERIMVHYCTIIPPTKQLNSFVPTFDCQIFFNKFVNRIGKMLPIKIMPIDQSFKSIKRDIKNGNGESREAITHAQYIIDKFNIGRYTFTKARYFAKKYGLNYLSNNYFQKIRSKQLIMS